MSRKTNAAARTSDEVAKTTPAEERAQRRDDAAAEPRRQTKRIPVAAIAVPLVVIVAMIVHRACS